MIIYGWREKNIDVQPINNHSCSNCNNNETLVAQVNKSYVHIFWIPFIPLFKKVYSVCTHCKQVLEKNEMPPDLQNKTYEIKQDAKTPLWYYAGLILLGIVFTIPFTLSIFK